MNKVLTDYCKVSGQVINRGKSKVIHNKELHPKFMRLLFKTFKIPTTRYFPKYLGVPSIIGRTTHEHFDDITQRFENRLASWKFSLLNKAGRLTLVNSVLTALPNYMMTVYEFPKGVIKILEKKRRDFLWGDEKDKHKVYMFNKDKAKRRKNLGGLGVKDLKLQNTTLMGKLGWELIQQRNSWTKLIKSKYFPNTDFLNSRTKRNDSKVWKTISKLKLVIKEGIVWKNRKWRQN